MKSILTITMLLAGSSFLAGALVQADDGKYASRTNGTTNAVASHAADNTGKNKRDRHEAALTSDNAASSANERELAANIRRSVVKDDSLSSYAQNVKIIVDDGKVTLRGPVESILERDKIEKRATELAGNMRVDNQIEVVKSR